MNALDARRLNLGRANTVRAERAQLKGWVAAPPTRAAAWARAAQVLDRVWPEIATMPADGLLKACAHTGPEAVHAVLVFAGIEYGTPLGKLRAQQRKLLRFALRSGSVKAMRTAAAEAIGDAGAPFLLPPVPSAERERAPHDATRRAA